MADLETLRRDGYVTVACETTAASALRDELEAAHAFTGHVIPQGDRIPRSLSSALAHVAEGRGSGKGFVCHRMADVLAAPGMFEVITRALPIVESYFGEAALLYSVNAFWKKPDGAPGWHHDSDDGDKQLVMFMYGTDVLSDDDGVHAHVTGSHLWPRDKLKPWHNVQEDVSGPLPADWPVHRFYGPAGTTFLTDTRGLHNGFAPVKDPRLLVWARWCSKGGPPASYKNDEIKPVTWRRIVAEKPDPQIRWATRLVVDWT